MKLPVVALMLSMTTLLWAVKVIAGYVFDSVASYIGETPMALDTAICLAALSISGMILAKYRINDEDE